VLQLTYSNAEKPTGRPRPSRIGRYQLIGKLANGGMAEAYLALSGELTALRSLVVVKRILPHLSSQEQFVRMFLDEARIGALLDHPNIARIIEVGRDGDGYFLVMEPVQGKPLSAVLRRAAGAKRPLGHAQAAFIVGQAANGLGYAHALTDAGGSPLNIVHRDISPQNILVSFEGAVKVIDFGVASALGRITETIPGGLKGKIEYMSPEQASGDSADRRSDIFALGVVLWEALCGRRLFRRHTELETMRAIFDEPIPRLPKDASVPPRLENIVLRALERAPGDRFQDAREMALLLQQHAFRSDGFNLIQLSAQMKSLFAADHAGWKAAAGAGLSLEGKHPRKITASFSLATSPGSHTAERTVALQASSVPEMSYLAGPESEPVDTGRSSVAKSVPTDGRPSRSRRWIGGSILLLALVLTAGRFLFVRRLPVSMAGVMPTNTSKVSMLVVPIPPSEIALAAKAGAAPPASPPAEPANPDRTPRAPSAVTLAAPTRDLSASPLRDDPAAQVGSPPIRPVRRAAARLHNNAPATRTTDPHHRSPLRPVAKAVAGKRRVAVTQRKVVPTIPANPPPAATTRPPWHDPFD
jgi:serine/threonine protein kinase